MLGYAWLHAYVPKLSTIDSQYIAVIYNSTLRTVQQLQSDNIQSDLALMIDTPYRALTGELWGVFRELFEEKWLWYILSTL